MFFAFFCYTYKGMICRIMISETKLILIQTFFNSKIYSLSYRSFPINLLIFDKREIGLQLLHSCWLPFLNIDIILANFREFQNTPVLNNKFTRVHHGPVISLFRSFSILTGKLLGPIALFRLKVFKILATLSGVEEIFLCRFFVKKKLTQLLGFF